MQVGEMKQAKAFKSRRQIWENPLLMHNANVEILTTQRAGHATCAQKPGKNIIKGNYSLEAEYPSSLMQ